jgi:mono/diheme cytochrome c family protein
MSARAVCCAFVLFVGLSDRIAPAAVPSSAVVTPALPPAVAAYFEAHCFACHTADASADRLDLKTLSTDYADPLVAARWQQVLQRILGNEMPPPEEPRPAVVDTQQVAMAIRHAAAEAVAKQRAEHGRVAARRLNRIEYENTLRDLLGVDVSVRESLPADSVTDGFDNQSSALHTSSFLLDRYLEAADVGLDAAIANRRCSRSEFVFKMSGR